MSNSQLPLLLKTVRHNKNSSKVSLWNKPWHNSQKNRDYSSDLSSAQLQDSLQVLSEPPQESSVVSLTSSEPQELNKN